MKKDIHIPEVKEVYIAALQEYNEDHKTQDWNVYIINNNPLPLEMVLIVSKGKSASQKTSTMRHKLKVLPAKSFAKVEFIEDNVLKLDNIFQVTYFLNNKMFEKSFVFKAGSIAEAKAVKIPLLLKEGILAD